MHLFSLAALPACSLFSHTVIASHGAQHGLFHQHRDIDTPAVDPTPPSDFNTSQLLIRDLGVGMCDENTPCVNGACCGSNGQCGYAPAQCGQGCRSNCDAKAQCGQYAPSNSQKCPLNVCCSEYGFCGSTDDFCKWKGCDTKYGGCGDPPRPTCASSGNSIGKRNIGYYESWSSTRKCQAVQPEDLNLQGFTHLNFAFSFFDPKSFQIAPMDSNSGSLYNRFTGLKSKSPNLQTWISVGGWSFTDPGLTRTAFSDMASTSGNRQQFISGLIKFMSTYGFDGVDLDWEYPVADDRGGKSADMANYVSLVQEMESAFGGKYGISMTLPTSYWYLQGFDLAGIQGSVDWFNLMSYDLHGVWDATDKEIGPIINPHTNITEIDLGLDLLWRAGVTPDKVVMGQGWYGRSFTLKDPSCNMPNGICQFTGGAKAGPCSDASGILDMQEINDIIAQNHLNPTLNKEAAVKWINWDSDQWVSYDDDETFGLKRDFANGRCLGGLMVWAMDQVDQNADNGQSPVPGVTPQQKANSGQMGSDLNAVTTCYTSKCAEKCKRGYHEVAQMTGQPSDVNTQICPKDKKKHQEHESLCCPSGTNMGQCSWRGYRGLGLPCNAGCLPGETEVAKNTNHLDKNIDQTCTGGLQSYCCSGFAPPPPPKKKESVGQKIKDAFDKAGQDIKQGFDDFGKDIKDAAENFAEGALMDIASKLVCRVIVPGVMGVAEVAEDAVPVAGEIADAGEIAAEPGIIDACSKGMDKLVSKVKGKFPKPATPKAPVQPRDSPKPRSSVPASKPTDDACPDSKRKRTGAALPAGQPNFCLKTDPGTPAKPANAPKPSVDIRRPENEDKMPNSLKCGETSYSKDSMIKALTQGMSYFKSPRPGGGTAKFQDGTISWQTTGNGKYPHVFKGKEIEGQDNKPPTMKPLDPACETARKAGKILEFPILASGKAYQGGNSVNSQAQPNADRVLFMQVEDDSTEQSKPPVADKDKPAQPRFCGLMTHTGAAGISVA